jgi:hypothetical protein
VCVCDLFVGDICVRLGVVASAVLVVGLVISKVQ